MPSMTEFIILGFAAWRITSIINREKIAYPIRKRFGIKKDTATGVEIPPTETFWSYLILCFRCLSVWVGISVVLIYLVFPLLLVPFAVSGIAILIGKYI